jgi:hypothetical protein
MTGEDAAEKQVAPIWGHIVGVVARGLGSTGDGGILWVFPGRIHLQMRRLSRWTTGISEVVHSEHEVRLVTTTFFVPWSNVSLVVESDDVVVTATMPIIWKRSLVTALEQAGFEVVHKRTWFSLGGEFRRGTSLFSVPFFRRGR